MNVVSEPGELNVVSEPGELNEVAEPEELKKVTVPTVLNKANQLEEMKQISLPKVLKGVEGTLGMDMKQLKGYVETDVETGNTNYMMMGETGKEGREPSKKLVQKAIDKIFA